MASDSNTMKSPLGIPLRHFTKEPSPLSAGINVFAQVISKEKNPYAFISILSPTGTYICNGQNFKQMKVYILLNPISIQWYYI
jgi:hypothetical protein